MSFPPMFPCLLVLIFVYIFQGCGASIAVETDGSGEVKSPNYPNFYRFGLNCTWHLSAPEG